MWSLEPVTKKPVLIWFMRIIQTSYPWLPAWTKMPFCVLIAFMVWLLDTYDTLSTKWVVLVSKPLGAVHQMGNIWKKSCPSCPCWKCLSLLATYRNHLWPWRWSLNPPILSRNWCSPPLLKASYPFHFLCVFIVCKFYFVLGDTFLS